MKNILILLSAIISIASCKPDSKSNQSNSYTVILDLSDRILQEHQAEKDIASIKAVFSQFENNVKAKLTVGSKDAFSVLIIPQKGSKLDHQFFEDRLHFDMATNVANVKAANFKKFGENLDSILNQLYAQAKYSNDATQYFGVDIWQYINDYGQRICDRKNNSEVVILTDGYFDFESDKHVIKNKNRSTNTNFINALTMADWEAEATKNNFGLIPIKLGGSCKCIVAGIHSKNNNDITQNKKLIYFWEKWLIESGASNFGIIQDANSETLKTEIKKQL